eukprot:6469781-Amphidinium_carterae.1
MVELLDTDSGKAFCTACHFLNGGNEEVQRDEEGVMKAIDGFVDFLQTDAHVLEKQDAFAKLAQVGSTLYLMGMEGLEAMAAVNGRKEVAACLTRIASNHEVPAETKEWLKQPMDDALMRASMAASFYDQKVAQPQKLKTSLWEEADEVSQCAEDTFWTEKKVPTQGSWWDDDAEDAAPLPKKQRTAETSRKPFTPRKTAQEQEES